MKKLLFLLFVFALLALFGQEYFFPKKSVEVAEKTAEFNPDDFANMGDISVSDDLAQRVIATNPPVNPIEQARNATFFIATPWGKTGSGFVLDTDCVAVTDQQLFTVETTTIITQQERIRAAMRSIQQELAELDSEYNYVVDVQGIGENSRQIDAEMTELANAENKLQKQLDKLSMVTTRSDFTVYFIDRSEYTIDAVKFSTDHSLAFFKIPEKQCPYINTGYTRTIATGQTLTTLGSEGQLDFEMQYGEYLGEYTHDDKTYLKTNAPIHKQNVGGPLLDKRGEVVGITTHKFLDKPDLGYAIPMHTVIKEFEKHFPR